MENELWQPVPYAPFDRMYSVSDLGHVKPNTPSRYSKNGAEVLKPARAPHRRYFHVVLYADGQRRSCYIHRMVALAFLGQPPFPDALVCHKDDDRANNRADNLEWGTNLSNAATREAIGKTSRGTGNGRAKLTEDDVREIRALYAQGGVSQAALAERFGMEQTAVSKIVLRKLWPHVT